MLASGTRIGPCEIAGSIGIGGMGEVYRARDTQLKRDVAVKVLPAAVAQDADRTARFQREAELLAALNHPHIAQIFGLERTPDGVPALVMELVDGPTLAQHIDRGPMTIEEAVPIAVQLAQALEYAHERGIIHRDLKPANIKVPPGGIKVLDFGLAKALAVPGAPERDTDAPTVTSPAMTAAGALLGTAAYMSPEQARGAAADKRADVWAFGAVLYEMLAGRRAFEGATVSDTLAAVLKTEPDWAKLPADLDPRLRTLLRRCLAKDRRQRLHDIADARLELEAVSDSGAPQAAVTTGGAIGSVPRLSIGPRIAWMALGAAAALAAVAASASLGIWPRTTQPPSNPLRVSIVHTEGGEVDAPAISPDGRRIAYRARRADGMPIIWVRDLDRSAPRALAGTEDGTSPFWSPDSRQVAFFAGGWIKRVPADGGPIEGIAAVAGSGGGAAWAPDGTIVFALEGAALQKVKATGTAATAKVEPATTLPSKDWSHYWPSFLPDGRHFLFTAKLWTQSAESSEQGVYVGSLDNAPARKLLPDLSSAVYAAPGYLVFAREGALWVRPFDAAALRFTGEPRPLGEPVAVENVLYQAAIAASADGTLAVRPPPASTIGVQSAAVLRIVNRTGQVIASDEVARHYSYFMALDPRGQRVAAAVVEPRGSTTDLWLFDLATGQPAVPLTATHGFAGSPVWAPDGTHITYSYQPPDQLDDVYVKDLQSADVTPLIETPAVWEHPAGWSRDGEYLLVARYENDGPIGIAVWSRTTRRVKAFVDQATGRAVFSPDGRYVAFASSVETGRAEVFVTTFPERHRTWPITTEGATALSWRNDGREILVATLSGHIAAIPVSTDAGLTHGAEAILVRDVGITAQFSSATPDHTRILIRVSPDAAKDRGEIRLLFGWAPR